MTKLSFSDIQHYAYDSHNLWRKVLKEEKRFTFSFFKLVIEYCEQVFKITQTWKYKWYVC